MACRLTWKQNKLYNVSDVLNSVFRVTKCIDHHQTGQEHADKLIIAQFLTEEDRVRCDCHTYRP